MENQSSPRYGSPLFYSLLEELAETHSRKSHDYASDENPSGNYHFAGRMALLFSHSSEDAGFFGRIAEKIYRLSNLESAGKSAKNESIEDTERDIAVITCLWMADRRARRQFISPGNISFKEQAPDKLGEIFPPVTPEELVKLCDNLLFIANRISHNSK